MTNLYEILGVEKTASQDEIKKAYKKLAKKKGKQKAICATARKICCIVYAMLSKSEKYRTS